MTAAIWCKEHVPTKTIVHRMHDVVDEESGLNALQLYVQNFKQADLGLTGTVRKATLVSQSTKIANPTSVAPPQNRRTSTTVHNSGSNTSRSSLSHVKPDGTLGETSSTAPMDSKRTCVTCSVNVSPKWWPFPHTSAHDDTATISIKNSSPERDNSHSDSLCLTNGHVVSGLEGENNGGHIALATAALYQNPSNSTQLPIEFQCHQCHWKKKQKQLPSAPSITRQEATRPPLSTPLPSPAVLPRDSEILQQSQHPSPYSWPAPPPPTPHTINGPSSVPPSVSGLNGTAHGLPYGWSRPSPTAQSMPLVSQLNGNHSPRVSTGSLQGLGSQSQMRHTNHGLPHSPRQNGHHPQLSNGYPPSPRHSHSSPALHMQSIQNGSYASYASTRPPPQHLTNGGPPPRAPEHPFPPGSAHIHSRGSFGPRQGSPSILRDNHAQGRDQNNAQGSNARANDGRVNGGASASPSLRNLLS